MMLKPRIVMALMAAAAFGLTACHAKPQQLVAAKTLPVQKTPDAEPSLRDKVFEEVPGVARVYFDFDSAVLRRQARDILKKNSDVLSSHGKWSVLVEGHCDERGSVAYNLALGQRRAQAVREYYETLGVPGSRIATISYGKEKPLCEEHTEDCWAMNRRAETKVAEPGTSESPGTRTL